MKGSVPGDIKINILHALLLLLLIIIIIAKSKLNSVKDVGGAANTS